MANRDLNPEQTEMLEAFVDACGLGAVIESLSSISGQKADHIRASYETGETTQTRAWRTIEGKLGVLACDPAIPSL